MGARGPAPKEKTTISYRPGLPEAPDWLSAEGRAVYDRVAEEMEAAGVSPQQVDFGLVSRYANAASEYAILAELIRADGRTIKGSDGAPKQNPLCAVQAKHAAVMQACESALGFSPASRSRIPKSGATGKSENPLLTHIGKTAA